MVLVTSSVTASPGAPAERPGFRSLLTPLRAAAWRAYLYLVMAYVTAVVGLAYVFCVGLGSAPVLLTVAGILLVAGAVLTGRLWNRLHRSMARLMGVTIDAPAPFIRPEGWWLTLRAALTDGVGWRSLGFLALQGAVLTVVGSAVLGAVAAAGFLVASPVVWWLSGHAVVLIDQRVKSPGAYLLLSLAGLVALYVLGWVMLGVSRAHVRLAQALLSPSERERRVAQLERARADVVEDSAATLRRVERDLHDGTQARLITVAMALARAEEQLAESSEPTRVSELVSDALANTKETLTELRDLVRGIRPPALDLGLGAAVQTLAARSPIPVEVTDDIQVRPPVGVETLAYFCVTELLANVSRHSAATEATVRLLSDSVDLRIIVSDNGSGGATVGGGSGLTGLRDRLAMVDGRLEIDSPAGGPTAVTVVVPSGAGT
ncbi:sensor histidine kinase [Mycobacterium sp.]|uniref:sensor histidine kinase n=1 Tax=Mycobacterium sp. TaxID=1785 RepID=UPI003D6A1876